MASAPRGVTSEVLLLRLRFPTPPRPQPRPAPHPEADGAEAQAVPEVTAPEGGGHCGLGPPQRGLQARKGRERQNSRHCTPGCGLANGDAGEVRAESRGHRDQVPRAGRGRGSRVLGTGARARGPGGSEADWGCGRN